MKASLQIKNVQDKLFLDFSGRLTLYDITKLQTILNKASSGNINSVIINLKDVSFIDTAVGIFLVKLKEESYPKNIQTFIVSTDEVILSTLKLVEKQRANSKQGKSIEQKKRSILEKSLLTMNDYLKGFNSFISFLGHLFVTKLYYIKSFKNIRFKEIAFEINESAVKALAIVALTSFLIGLVVAYQSAFQLKLYGANIFIVDMLGISILRELAPLITAIVIAGRSGSAFTAQIGAMKITQELDAMKTMGFDPFVFLVLPRIIALMIALPILIFVSDIMGIFGGMIVSYIDLGITADLFMDRFREVVAAKHFFIGIIKGPFFAFLIASIGIYRGLVVKDDTQSIGFNTTKSVVESIFAVIICDALFSIALTNLGI